MLKKEGKITDAVIENMLSWRHSGFHVYIGDRIFSDDQTGLGNLARCIIRACFSQERMVYNPEQDSRSVRTDGEVLRLVFEQISGDEKKGRSG